MSKSVIDVLLEFAKSTENPVLTLLSLEGPEINDMISAGTFTHDITESDQVTDYIPEAISSLELAKQRNCNHEFDPESLYLDYDGDTYVDCLCKHCGLSGCIGVVKNDRINWEEV